MSPKASSSKTRISSTRQSDDEDSTGQGSSAVPPSMDDIADTERDLRLMREADAAFLGYCQLHILGTERYSLSFGHYNKRAKRQQEVQKIVKSVNTDGFKQFQPQTFLPIMIKPSMLKVMPSQNASAGTGLPELTIVDNTNERYPVVTLGGQHRQGAAEILYRNATSKLAAKEKRLQNAKQEKLKAELTQEVNAIKEQGLRFVKWGCRVYDADKVTHELATYLSRNETDHVYKVSSSDKLWDRIDGYVGATPIKAELDKLSLPKTTRPSESKVAQCLPLVEMLVEMTTYPEYYRHSQVMTVDALASIVGDHAGLLASHMLFLLQDMRRVAAKGTQFPSLADTKALFDALADAAEEHAVPPDATPEQRLVLVAAYDNDPRKHAIDDLAVRFSHLKASREDAAALWTTNVLKQCDTAFEDHIAPVEWMIGFRMREYETAMSQYSKTVLQIVAPEQTDGRREDLSNDQVRARLYFLFRTQARARTRPFPLPTIKTFLVLHHQLSRIPAALRTVSTWVEVLAPVLKTGYIQSQKYADATTAMLMNLRLNPNMNEERVVKTVVEHLMCAREAVLPRMEAILARHSISRPSKHIYVGFTAMARKRIAADIKAAMDRGDFIPPQDVQKVQKAAGKKSKKGNDDDDEPQEAVNEKGPLEAAQRFLDEEMPSRPGIVKELLKVFKSIDRDTVTKTSDIPSTTGAGRGLRLSVIDLFATDHREGRVKKLERNGWMLAAAWFEDIVAQEIRADLLSHGPIFTFRHGLWSKIKGCTHPKTNVDENGRETEVHEYQWWDPVNSGRLQELGIERKTERWDDGRAENIEESETLLCEHLATHADNKEIQALVRHIESRAIAQVHFPGEKISVEDRRVDHDVAVATTALVYALSVNAARKRYRQQVGASDAQFEPDTVRPPEMKRMPTVVDSDTPSEPLAFRLVAQDDLGWDPEWSDLSRSQADAVRKTSRPEKEFVDEENEEEVLIPRAGSHDGKDIHPVNEGVEQQAQNREAAMDVDGLGLHDGEDPFSTVPCSAHPADAVCPPQPSLPPPPLPADPAPTVQLHVPPLPWAASQGLAPHVACPQSPGNLSPCSRPSLKRPAPLAPPGLSPDRKKQRDDEEISQPLASPLPQSGLAQSAEFAQPMTQMSGPADTTGLQQQLGHSAPCDFGDENTNISEV